MFVQIYTHLPHTYILYLFPFFLTGEHKRQVPFFTLCLEGGGTGGECPFVSQKNLVWKAYLTLIGWRPFLDFLQSCRPGLTPATSGKWVKHEYIQKHY